MPRVNAFGLSFGREKTQLVEAQQTDLGETRGQLMSAELEGERLRESVRELSLWLEDLNWTRLENWNAGDAGFSLEAIRGNSDKLQSLLTLNPTVKKAINARVGYIWGRGINIQIGNAALKKRVLDNPRNKAILFSEHAYWALEAKLATDGNVWAQRNTNTNAVALIPIDHIGGWVSDEDDPSRINYWLVQYEKTVQNFSTGETKNVTVKYFVPAHDAEPTNTTNIDGVKIDRKFEMVHIAANRQDGWILGVPDIMAVMFWTKAHKELFEAGTTYVKAQGKFAAKVIAKTDTGGAAAAATLRDTPRRDPETGESFTYGGTAVATGGLDIQLMGKMSGGVDFNTFDPVGGLIAAGLGIPVNVLLGKSTSDIESLEQSTVNEMQLRQKLWSWFFDALLAGKAEISWPKIRTEPEYRRIQSVEIANGTNVLSRPELRALTLEAFDMDGDPTELPPITQQPTVAIGIALKKAGVEPQAGAPAPVAGGGTSGGGAIDAKGQGTATGIGKLSDGGDAKASRNNALDKNTAGQ